MIVFSCPFVQTTGYLPSRQYAFRGTVSGTPQTTQTIIEGS